MFKEMKGSLNNKIIKEDSSEDNSEGPLKLLVGGRIVRQYLFPD